MNAMRLDLPTIAPVVRDDAFAHEVQRAIDAKTKPPGALGRLEEWAHRIACIQQSPRPRMDDACVIVFAGDHGVAHAGVAPYPQAVTAQMVRNFCDGGAAVCVFARSVGIDLQVVDAGVLTPSPAHPVLVDARIDAGTRNFAVEPAMTDAQCMQAIEAGIALMRAHAHRHAIAFGEMGIGNTTSAAALMHALTGTDAMACVGRGTGADDAMLARKRSVVEDAARLHGLHALDSPASARALNALRCVGGFEIAMMAGAMLGAAAQRQVVIVDGFISTAAYAVAVALVPALRGYAVAAHVSDETPHTRWLRLLDLRAALSLDMRLGEGSGAVLAVPLLRAACDMLRDMATFDSANVSQRETP